MLLLLMVLPLDSVARRESWAESAGARRSALCSEAVVQKGSPYRCAEVLEEQKIPVDYVAGTSMGAIVGALYAPDSLPGNSKR